MYKKFLAVALSAVFASSAYSADADVSIDDVYDGQNIELQTEEPSIDGYDVSNDQLQKDVFLTTLYTVTQVEKIFNGEDYFNPLKDSKFSLSTSENNSGMRPYCVVAMDNRTEVRFEIDMLKEKYGIDHAFELDFLSGATQVDVGVNGNRNIRSYRRADDYIYFGVQEVNDSYYWCPHGNYEFYFD
ncbi:hypothetical protein [Vibrio astriarenae]|uniref:hypothetical protein n=1 Tax=Vibrio astriarenae TaxID=1481923 RepID=UPI0037358AB2